MIRALFLDLDDTLCDANSAWNRAVSETFQTLLDAHPRVQPTALSQAWDRVHQSLFQALASGQMTMAAVRDIRFQRTLEEVGIYDSSYATELNTLLAQRQLTYLRLFEDVGCLESIGRGIHVGIITNGAGDTHPDSQRTKIEHLGLCQQVDSVWISDEVGYRKPDTRIFELACATAGILPQEAAFVGDSVSNDIRGSNRAGMISVLIDRAGQVSHHGNADETPTYKVRSLFEISTVLKG